MKRSETLRRRCRASTRRRSPRLRLGILATALTAALAIGGCATWPADVPDVRTWFGLTRPSLATEDPRPPVGSAAGHHAVGRLELAEGRLEAAEWRFRQALRLDPRHLEARNALGAVLSLQQRHDEAIAVLRQALAMFPDTAHLLGNLGYALQRAGQPEEARAMLERALALDPGLSRSQRNLSDLSAELLVVPVGPGAVSPARRVDIAVDGAESSTQATQTTRTPLEQTAQTPPPEQISVHDRNPPAATVSLAAIEVANAAGVDRLARRTARKLAGFDAKVIRLTEWRPFSARPTEVHYRAGYLDAAQALRRRLPIACELAQVDDLRADVNLRLIAGRDLASAHARW